MWGVCFELKAVSRGKVMAWECALENSIATLIGPVFVAKLALMFGYTFGEEEAEGTSLSAATALGQAMAADASDPTVRPHTSTFFQKNQIRLDFPQRKSQRRLRLPSASLGW